MKSRTIVACSWRWTSELRTGGWMRPNSGSSPPLELKWLAITNSVLPRTLNSPASGLRLLSNAGVGRVDPPGAERQLRAAPGRVLLRRARGGPARAIDELDLPVGPEQEADADVAARLAAVRVVDRVDLAELVARAAGGGDRGDEARSTSRAASVIAVRRRAVVVLDLLERRRCRALRRLSTRMSREPAELRPAGRPRSRFSTFIEAIATWRPGASASPRAAGRRRPRCGAVVTRYLKLPNE